MEVFDLKEVNTFIIIAVATFATFAECIEVPKLHLASMETVCGSSAAFYWTVDFLPTPSDVLHNCSTYSITPSSTEPKHLYKSYSKLDANGTFRLEHLQLRKSYSLQIQCSEVKSNVITFVTETCEQQHENNSTSPSVVEYKEPSAFSVNNRDSVLGIVFGLLGLLIIFITCFYVWRKFRRRRRIERIRSYLGASLIDPFENLQNTMDESGSRRLMESTESLS